MTHEPLVRGIAGTIQEHVSTIADLEDVQARPGQRTIIDDICATSYYNGDGWIVDSVKNAIRPRGITDHWGVIDE